MQKLCLFCFLSILNLTLGGFVKAASVLNQTAPDTDEYAVFKAILQQEFIGEKTRQLVIRKQTNINDFPNEKPLDYLTGSLPPILKETIKDFNSRNNQSAELTDEFNLKLKINLVGKEINEIFTYGRSQNSSEDGWKIFHKKYPTARVIITLSRVGLNKNKTQALIYVGFGCGWLCGQGKYILLLKKDNKWKIEKKSMIWAS